MSLTDNKIIWVTEKQGITIEEYKGNYSMKGVVQYQSQGQTKLAYDWTFPQTWDKEARSWKPADKARPLSIYLGDHKQAIEVLQNMLDILDNPHPAPDELEDIPF